LGEQKTNLSKWGSSVVDYGLANDAGFHAVQKFEVLDRVDSTHLPISFIFQNKSNTEETNLHSDNGTNLYRKLKWRPAMLNSVEEKLNSTKSQS
jgi:hypothetical protein